MDLLGMADEPLGEAAGIRGFVRPETRCWDEIMESTAIDLSA